MNDEHLTQIDRARTNDYQCHLDYRDPLLYPGRELKCARQKNHLGSHRLSAVFSICSTCGMGVEVYCSDIIVDESSCPKHDKFQASLRAQAMAAEPWRVANRNAWWNISPLLITPTPTQEELSIHEIMNPTRQYPTCCNSYRCSCNASD